MIPSETGQIPYWFWQGFGLIILYLIGQLIVKWMDMKFFKKEDKWNGEERRNTIEIDEKLLEKFYNTYERHVKFVGELAMNAETSNKVLGSFVREFQSHDQREEESQRIIRKIHSQLSPEV